MEKENDPRPQADLLGLQVLIISEAQDWKPGHCANAGPRMSGFKVWISKTMQ